MSMKILFLCLSLLTTVACFGERYLQPVKYEDQEELFERGGLMLFSSKNNDILFYQTRETLKNNCANFFFSFTNCQDRNINVLFHNLTVTDQYGRIIKVVPKKQLLKGEENNMAWAMLFSGVVELADTLEANQAGKTTVHTHTHGSACANTARVRNGYVTNSAHADVAYSSSSCSVIQSEAERQKALRMARQDAALRNLALTNKYQTIEGKIHDNYFDSQTVYPEESFSANVQIEVPKYIEKDLQYIYFHFNIDDETHIFAVYAGQKK